MLVGKIISSIMYINVHDVYTLLFAQFFIVMGKRSLYINYRKVLTAVARAACIIFGFIEKFCSRRIIP